MNIVCPESLKRPARPGGVRPRSVVTAAGPALTGLGAGGGGGRVESLETETESRREPPPVCNLSLPTATAGLRAKAAAPEGMTIISSLYPVRDPSSFEWTILEIAWRASFPSGSVIPSFERKSRDVSLALPTSD